MMVVIKRYPNRKLYDTEAKRYVTLEDVTERIRRDQEIQVIDYTTGEDITAVTLTQIIVEQEKRRNGFLPNSFLAGLIRSNSEWISSIQHGLRPPFIFQHQIEEQIRERIQERVRAGALSEAEADNVLAAILDRSSSSKDSHLLDIQIQDFLARNQTPTRQDIQILDQKIDSLAERLEGLLGSES
jgi:polyhydroxyalkanoate synthesis repressor PhaR